MIKSFNGKTPQIDDSAFISETAYVVGDVVIGAGCSVWPGAVVRGDTGRVVIGANTAIEDNCVVHSANPGAGEVCIGDNVNIGHGAVVHGRRIGNNVLIGINATILHDAVIGDGCLIGAGCVVGEDMVVPDGSFVVGVPGKIKGKVSPEQQFWLTHVPGEYAELGRRYKEEGL